jgi:CDP-diacylglycerol--glycerol-3-phosphate 3-phosphatidyltransferase
MGVFTHWPNRITAMRFLGTIALLALLSSVADLGPTEVDAHRTTVLIAFWLFVLTAASDVVDGYIARKYEVVTAFGRIADPFTDKFLILGVMLYGAVMPWTRVWMAEWMVATILARELLVTGIRGYVEKVGGEFPADRWGKLKMLLQSISTGGLLWMEAFAWEPGWFERWSIVLHVVVGSTVAATVLSGVNYVLRTRRILAETDR